MSCFVGLWIILVHRFIGGSVILSDHLEHTSAQSSIAPDVSHIFVTDVSGVMMQYFLVPQLAKISSIVYVSSMYTVINQ